MSKADDNDNLSGGGYLAWLFISVVTILMVTLIIPFPISLAVSLIIIIALYVIRADMGLKKTGMGGIRVGINQSLPQDLVEVGAQMSAAPYIRP